MGATLWGPLKTEGDRDENRYRTFKVTWLIHVDSTDDGAYAALNCPGLPLPGAPWSMGNDYDPWVWCRPNAVARLHMHKDGDPHLWWTVEQTFSNKPEDAKKNECKDQSIENPLLQPMEVSGGSSKDKQEITVDRFGRDLINSAHERLHGPQLEFDILNSSVKIKQNVAVLDKLLCDSIADHVNDDWMWGFPPRSVRLANWTWNRKLWGLCFRYFERSFDFEIKIVIDRSGQVKGGWDRDLLDEGTKVLNGHWRLPTETSTGTGASVPQWILDPVWDGAEFVPPDPADPTHFIRYKDRNGENTKVILDGHGQPAKSAQGPLFLAMQNSLAVDPQGGVAVSAFWLLIRNPGRPYEIWSLERTYYKGDLVDYQGTLYLYVASVEGEGSLPDSSPGVWQSLLTLSSVAVLTNRGLWDKSYNYQQYDVVRTQQEAGKIHVEHFDEANLFLLGLPVDLEL